MQTSDFLPYFQKIQFLEKHFLGTFAINQIPQKIKPKSFFVCNTDPSYLSGKHWIAFIKLDDKYCEIFDSLGVKINELLPHFNFTQKIKFIYNDNAFQSPNSKLCGKFVITFIVERMLNQTMDFDELLENIFSEDQQKNDEIVTNFCNNL